MTRIRNQWNYAEKGLSAGEKNYQASETVPNQALTVTEMLRRMASGLPITNAREPIYNGDIELPDMNRLDISEKAQLMEENTERIEQLSRKQKAKKAAAKSEPVGEEESTPEGENKDESTNTP